MFFARLALYFGLIIATTNGFKFDELISNIIGDVTDSLVFPAASISALFCAKTEDLVEFSKVLSKHGTSVHYLDFEDFDRYVDLFTDQQHKTILILDYDCPRAVQILNKANSLGLFSAPIKWMIVNDLRENLTKIDHNFIIKELRDYSIYPDSEVIILHVFSNDYAELSSIYRPSLMRSMIVEPLARWNKKIGLNSRDDRVASQRRRNLQLTALKSSIVVTNPDTLNHLSDYRDKHIDTITKCNYVWLKHLIDAMNATVNVSVVNSWGYRDKKNGTWNGMMGLLAQREIDIGGTGIFLTSDRLEYCHYLPLSTPSRLAFVFRQPPLSFVSNLFTLPFRKNVWLAIGLMLIVIFVLIVVSTRWEWTVRKVNSPPPTLIDDLLLVVGAVAQQGSGRNPTTVSSRIVILMLLMAVLNLYASYSANIVALLQSTSTSIKTLKNLLDSPIKCGAQDIVYMRYYFNLEKDPIRRAIIDQKIELKIGNKLSGKSNWMTAEDGIKNVRLGFFAFFMEVGPAYRMIQETFEEDEKCGFREMHFIEHTYPTFTIVKKSPYIEIIRVNSLKIEESGLKSREMLKFYTNRPPCNGRSKFVSVGLSECYFAFYAMGFGASAAFLLFLLEILWTKSLDLKNRKNKDDEF